MVIAQGWLYQICESLMLMLAVVRRVVSLGHFAWPHHEFPLLREFLLLKSRCPLLGTSCTPTEFVLDCRKTGRHRHLLQFRYHLQLEPQCPQHIVLTAISASSFAYSKLNSKSSGRSCWLSRSWSATCKLKFRISANSKSSCFRSALAPAAASDALLFPAAAISMLLLSESAPSVLLVSALRPLFSLEWS